MRPGGWQPRQHWPIRPFQRLPFSPKPLLTPSRLCFLCSSLAESRGHRSEGAREEERVGIQIGQGQRQSLPLSPGRQEAGPRRSSRSLLLRRRLPGDKNAKHGTSQRPEKAAARSVRRRLKGAVAPAAMPWQGALGRTALWKALPRTQGRRRMEPRSQVLLERPCPAPAGPLGSTEGERAGGGRRQ